MQPILIVDPTTINMKDLCHAADNDAVSLVRLRQAGYGMLGKMDSMAWLQCLITAWADPRTHTKDAGWNYIEEAEKLYKEYIKGLHRTSQLDVDVWKEETKGEEEDDQ